MKKTKSIGSVLSTFFLISVACISAVQVQAAEADVRQFKSNLQDLVTKLCDDKDDLFALIEDLEDEKWNTYDEFVDILECKEIFNRLVNNNRYNNLCNSIKSSLTRIIQDMDEVSSQSFKIDRYADGNLKVTKPGCDSVNQGEILIDGNGDIDIPGYGTLDSSLLFALGMFALMCLAAALIVGVVAAVVFGLKFIAEKIGSGLQSILDELILAIVLYVVVGAVVSIIYTIASVLGLEGALPEKLQGILQQLSEITKSKPLTMKERLQVFNQRMAQILSRIRAMFRYQAM